MSGWFVDLKRLQSCIRDGEFSDQPRKCQVQPTSAEAKKGVFPLHVHGDLLNSDNKTKQKENTRARFELHSLRPHHLTKLVCSQGESSQLSV
jgi:hypothetical protein